MILAFVKRENSFYHAVIMSSALLHCLKLGHFRFTEAAIGHFISKEDTKSTKFGIMIGETFLTFVFFFVSFLSIWRRYGEYEF